MRMSVEISKWWNEWKYFGNWKIGRGYNKKCKKKKKVDWKKNYRLKHRDRKNNENRKGRDIEIFVEKKKKKEMREGYRIRRWR
jgi:hypothetical protein